MTDIIETLSKLIAAAIVIGWFMACLPDMFTWFERF